MVLLASTIERMDKILLLEAAARHGCRLPEVDSLGSNWEAVIIYTSMSLEIKISKQQWGERNAWEKQKACQNCPGNATCEYFGNIQSKQSKRGMTG
jgi:hypothetical protein